MSFKTIVILICIFGSVYMETLQTTVGKELDELKSPAQSITMVNAPLILIGQGPIPKIISGLANIIAQLNQNTGQTNPKIEGLTNPNKFCELMNILIGKAPDLHSLPVVGAPIAAVLRQLEGSVDANVNKEIAKLAEESTSQSQNLKQNLNKANACINLAIQSYQ